MVTAHTVDDLVQGLSLNRVDWMKLDVEGAECEVLEGSREVLSRLQPTIFVEVHGTRSELNRLLGAVGYTEVSWRTYAKAGRRLRPVTRGACAARPDQGGADRCFDLLHQRQGRVDAGLDPDKAKLRSAKVVEGYEQ